MKPNTNKILNQRNKGVFSPVNKSDTQPLKSGKQNPNGIIMNIAKAFKDKSRKEIQTWRLSLLATELIENPRFNRYYDLVDDLKTDGTFKTQILLRKSATLSCSFQIRNRKTGVINELASELFQQKWFYKYLNIELDSILYGTRIVEFSEFNNHIITFAVVPPRNTVPTEKKIFPDLGKEKVFILYNDPIHKPWVVELNPDNPLGLINDIIPNLIWKRNVAQSWAEFCEKFGMPLISATTNNSNTTHIENVEKQLLSLAEASVGVFPEGTSIKFDEANRTDAYNVYNEFIKHNSNEIAGVIVGSNTLTTTAANRSQTEVHERTLDFKITQADRRDIAFNLNDDILPILKTQGYSYISDDDIFEWIESKEEIDLDKLWVIVQGMMLEYEIDQEWLAKTFNVKIIGKKKTLTPTELNKITALFKMPNYPVATCCPKHSFPIAQGNSKILDDLTNKLLQKLWDNESTLSSEGLLIVEESLQLTQGLKSGFGVTAGYNTPDTLAYQMMEYNLFEFSASKTEARLALMTDLLLNKDKNGINSYKDFEKLASEKVGEFNKNWLQSEYNLSVAVGQNTAQYHRFMADKADFPYVEYQTAGDDKVRNQHRLLDGKIFNLNDSEAMKLWPPNGYGCRCEMLQTNKKPKKGALTGKEGIDLMKQSDPKWKDSQFEINRADLKKVFTTEQYYSDIKGLPKKLNEMTFDKYDLPKWDSFKSNLNPISLDKSITGDNVKELFKPVKNEKFMGFKDYFDRKLTLSQANFDKHTKGFYLSENENRHQLFAHLKDLIANPDEVWYKNPGKKIYNKFQSRYIKFYKDLVLIADCDMTATGLEILTWYEAKHEDLYFRKGLLVWNKNK